MGQETLLPILGLVVVGGVVFAIYKRKKNKTKSQQGQLGSQRYENPNEKKDEVWRTIKDFLKENKVKGAEIVSSYSIRRPLGKDLHKRLREADIYIAKLKAKENNQKYVKPVIPAKYDLEDYFEKQAQETYLLTKKFYEKNDQEIASKFAKGHRQDLINKELAKKQKIEKLKFWKKLFGKNNTNDYANRELYVLIFKTKDVKTKEVSEPRAIEVEIVKEQINRKDTSRKIVINKEVDLEKEMKWIFPTKDQDDKQYQKEIQKNKKFEEKLAIRAEKKANNQLWYQKYLPYKQFVGLMSKIKSKFKK